MTKGTFNVWYFRDSGEAYDATQVDERIKNGDVLIVPSEKVAGVLVEAWPVAVTEAFGHFHQFSKDADISAFPSVSKDKIYDFTDAVAYAKAVDFDTLIDFELWTYKALATEWILNG